MSVPLAKRLRAATWVAKNVKPLVASLASQGKIDGVEAMDILEGIDGLGVTLRQAQELELRGWPHERLLALVAFVEKHGDAIKRAAG